MDWHASVYGSRSGGGQYRDFSDGDADDDGVTYGARGSYADMADDTAGATPLPPSVDDAELRRLGGNAVYFRAKDVLKSGRMHDMAVSFNVPDSPRTSGTMLTGGIGKKALFPTANLIPEEHIIALKRGVYATRAHLPNGETCVGVTNVGVRPTVSDKNTVTIETYLVGFDGDLYGQKLQLDFFDYLREEKKFSSTQELHDMIAQNAREAEMIVK